VTGTDLPDGSGDLFDEADAVVMDAGADHALGGTGRTLPWASLASRVAALRSRATLVLAGGLTPLNVAGAVAALSPEVVDVSSGIESAPGIKDHNLMRAFLDAARRSPGAA
jgi:phosphoribosylanthranilate isomerase